MGEQLDSGAGGTPPVDALPVAVPLTPRILRLEVLMVLALGLGPGLIDAVVLLARYLIGGREAIVSFSRIPGHPWSDCGLQILLGGRGRSGRARRRLRPDPLG